MKHLDRAERSIRLLTIGVVATCMAAQVAFSATPPNPCSDATQSAISAARDFQKAARGVRSTCANGSPSDCSAALGVADAALSALTGANLAMADTCGIAPPPPPPPDSPTMFGDLLINEAFIDASTNDREWFEIFNPTSTEFSLDGLEVRITSGGTHSFPIDGPLTIPAFGFVVIGKTTDPALNDNANVDFAATFTLPNAGFLLEIYNGTTLIDSVDFALQFADILPGMARQLDPSPAPDASSNDDPANWCNAGIPFGTFGQGTPGSINTDTCF